MDGVMWVLSMLPGRMREEIGRIGTGRRDFPDGLSEVRLRAFSRSALLLSGENVPLASRVDGGEIGEIVRRMLGDSLYAYRDSIREGYITAPGGIRVGLSGRARYEGGELVGVDNMTSLVFRVPHGRSDTAGELYAAWEAEGRPGLLIYSPPGVGKTTSLRALAGLIGGGSHPSRVVVVDERCEFLPEDYRCATVDILAGYRRDEGIAVATRTLSPEVVLVDEIGGAAEAGEMLSLLRAGIPVIATAHAGSYRELLQKRSLLPFLRGGVFRLFAGIHRQEQGFVLTLDRAPEAEFSPRRHAAVLCRSVRADRF